MEKVISVHKVNNTKEFSFDPKVYSLFKYGCYTSTVELARSMAQAFIEYDRLYNIIDEDTPIVIAPAAYRTIPCAAAYLADNIKLVLNWYYHQKGIRPVTLTKIHRVTSYSGDYGTLSQEEREVVLSKERLSVNEDVIKNSFVLFVDDIKITGTHEKLVEGMINTYSTKGYAYLYFAEATANVDPSIENYLNKASVSHVSHMVRILYGKHNLSARMIKEILRLNATDLQILANQFNKPDLFINIVNQSIAEGYDRVPDFKQNFNYLKHIVINEFNKPKEAACY